LGILLVPEVIEYPSEQFSSNIEQSYYRLIQSRFCLTKLDINKLADHARFFGTFHLEFSYNSIIELGAIPVMYLPRIDKTSDPLSLKHLASSFIYRLCELQNLCEDIHNLELIASTNKKDKKVKILRGNDGQTIDINIKQLRNILEIITCNIAPYSEIYGAIQGMASLFYPSDLNYNNEFKMLHYYNQHEWRIVGGISINGNRLDTSLNLEEKDMLQEIDKSFFTKEFPYGREKDLLINGCSVIKIVNEKSIHNFITRIIVPSGQLAIAKEIADRYCFPKEKIVSINQAICSIEYEI